MKLGLRKSRRHGRARYATRRHGNMPAVPRAAATAYEGGHEIKVYQAPNGRYYAVVPGAGTRAKMHDTIREAVREGRDLAETLSTRSRSAAYTRSRLYWAHFDKGVVELWDTSIARVRKRAEVYERSGLYGKLRRVERG